MSKKLIAISIGAALLAGAAIYGFAMMDSTGEAPSAKPEISATARPEELTARSQPSGFVPGAAELEFANRVRQNAYWQLPFDNRVPGVDSVKLVDSTEEWLAGLPAAERLEAEAFVRRNGVAFQFETREQQAWLLDRGFPALEEFVAYTRLPESERRPCTPGSGQVCRNEKLAYLATDALLAEAELLLANAKTSEGSLESTKSTDEQTVQKLAQVRAALGLLNGEKSMLYRMHLISRLNQLDAGIYTDAETARVQAASALAIARFCGDSRVVVSDNQASIAASATLQLLPTSISVSEAACGVRPGSRWFMPDARGKAAIASSN